jgi:hypothetical protein
MTDWFRSWHGAPTDPKWLVIALRAKVPAGMVSAVAWALMDRASQAKPRGSVAGFDAETYAAFSGFPVPSVEATLAAMREKAFIVGDRLAAWDSRNPGDYSTDRVREHREKKRNETHETPGNGVKRSETPGNTEESRGEEIRSESNRSASVRGVARAREDAVRIRQKLVDVFGENQITLGWSWADLAVLLDAGFTEEEILRAGASAKAKGIMPRKPAKYLRHILDDMRQTARPAAPAEEDPFVAAAIRRRAERTAGTG